MSGSDTRVYLVRHGETDWNRCQRLQGAIDTPLNPTGFDQATRLADWFETRGVSHVISSPLSRAHDTAVPIARSSRCPLTTDADLVELDHGAWTGLTVRRIARISAGTVIDGGLHSESLAISDGETVDAAYTRAARVLRHLLAAPPSSAVVVVSHGITNALLICAAMGQAATRLNEYTQLNGCVYVLRFRRRTLVSAPCQLCISPMWEGAERRCSSWSASV